MSYALTPAEVRAFHDRGFTEPFDVLDATALTGIRPTFEKILSGGLRSPIYDRTTHRDWHLHFKNLLTMVYRPHVIERLKPLLGENLLVWRTSIFHKAPGDGSLAWHQSSLFTGEEYGIFKPALLPPPEYEIYTDLFNVSVGNGAMQVAIGTHTGST